MNKILTIIIPTYNMEKYLRRCLDSLIIDEEGMKQLEVLVINDGSKDSSSKIAHEYQDKYPDTYRVIDKENGNYGSCINHGLKEATGKYVKVLDADDWFDTKNFAKLLTVLGGSNVDLMVSDYCNVNESGAVIGRCKYRLPQEEVVFNEETRAIFNRKNFQMHAATYKLELLRKMNYKQTEGISYTDQEWIYTPLMAVNTVGYYPRIVYNYLIGRVGQTMSAEALKRGVRQNQQCILRIVRDYAMMPPLENQSMAGYLKDQAYISLRTVYYSYLVKYADLSLDGLLEFDKDIKLVGDNILAFSDEIILPGTNYHFVKKWHQNNTRPSSVCYRLNRLVSRVYCRLLREFNKD